MRKATAGSRVCTRKPEAMQGYSLDDGPCLHQGEASSLSSHSGMFPHNES